jgi:hypothetical protein
MNERAVSQRTSIPWVLPPWSDETPPFARRTDPPAPCDDAWDVSPS